MSKTDIESAYARTPTQAQTDTVAVFRDETDFHGNIELIARVEVPRFSQPNSEGVRLDTDKRFALAVARAVESDESFVSAMDDPFMDTDTYDDIEGEQFGVMMDLSGDMVWVPYEQNPAFDAVWDPETDSE